MDSQRQRDEDALRLLYYGILTDVDEMMLLQKKLRESREQLDR